MQFEDSDHPNSKIRPAKIHHFLRQCIKSEKDEAPLRMHHGAYLMKARKAC